MQLSMKFVLLAVLAQVSSGVFASPIIDQSLAKRDTRADCQAACNLLLLGGQITQDQYDSCVSRCIAERIRTPPPTPPRPAPAPLPPPVQKPGAQKPAGKPPGKVGGRSISKRDTRADCQAACNLLLLSGQITQDQYDGCVSRCIAERIRTPPPTPPRPAPAPLPPPVVNPHVQKPAGPQKPITKTPGKVGGRSILKRDVRADCQAACNLLLLAGQITQNQWDRCVTDCIADRIRTPPPTPPRPAPVPPPAQQKPATKPRGKRAYEEDEE